MPLVALPHLARARSRGLLTLALGFVPCGLGCGLELGLDDVGTPDGHVQEPAGAGSNADAAVDAGLDAASRSDATVEASTDANAQPPASDSDARIDEHARDAGPADAGARTSDASAQAADGSASDATTAAANDAGTNDAGAKDASTNDATANDSGSNDPSGQPPPNATMTHFAATGRTCYLLDDAAKASQRALCQAELCGPQQVELELVGLPGGQFDLRDCTLFDPSIPPADVPIYVDLNSSGGSLRLSFDGAVRTSPLTLENLRAHVMWGEFTFLGVQNNQPANAKPYLDSSERLPVEIVDYRDEMIHVKLAYVQPSLSYNEIRDGFLCETPPSPFPGICTELYCSYRSGTGAGRAARTVKLDATGKLPTRLCP